MAFETFSNKSTRLGSPALTITQDGRFALNADAGDLLRQAKARYIKILWDAEARKIALLLAAKPDEQTYRLSPSSGHKRGMTLSAKSFLRFIGWDSSARLTVPVVWNEKDKLLVFALPTDQGAKRKIKVL